MTRIPYDPAQYQAERDALRGVPEQVSKAIQSALGHGAPFILILQAPSGGHVYTNQRETSEPAVMISVLEQVIELVRRGQGDTERIGPRQ